MILRAKTMTTLALAFVLMLVPGFPTAAGDLTDPEDQFAVVSPQGIGLPGGIDIPLNDQPPCEQTAPDETYCSTGIHVMIGTFAGVVLGPIGAGTFTLEARLYHILGVLVVQQTYENGVYQSGQADGFWPVGGVVYQECFSYELGSAGSDVPIPTQPNGTPGGNGVWRCGFLHD